MIIMSSNSDLAYAFATSNRRFDVAVCCLDRLARFFAKSFPPLRRAEGIWQKTKNRADDNQLGG